MADPIIIAILLVMLALQVYDTLWRIDWCCAETNRWLERIYWLLKQRIPSPVPAGVDFIQIGDDYMPTNFSIVAGSTGVFGPPVYSPAGSVPPATAVPAWVPSDPSLVPSLNGDGTVSVPVPASYPSPSFNLTLNVPFNDGSGTVLTATHTITVVQPTPPVPTSVDFAQVS